LGKVRIKNTMEFSRQAWMRKLAEKVIRAYPSLFFDVDLDRVIFLWEETGEDCQFNGYCRLIEADFRDILKACKVDADFIIGFMSSHCEGKSENWLAILMLHELMHIGYGLYGPKVMQHEIEEFTAVLRLAGMNWQDDNKDLPDILKKKLRLVA
jgi:hypothetical protein